MSLRIVVAVVPAGAVLVLVGWVLWTIRHPATCTCWKCSQRRDRREAAAEAYRKGREEQAERRRKRATDRLITDLREHRADEEKSLRRREKRALAAIEAAWDRDSAVEPQPRARPGGTP